MQNKDASVQVNVARKRPKSYSIDLHRPVTRNLLKLGILPLPILIVMLPFTFEQFGHTQHPTAAITWIGTVLTTFFYWQLFHRHLKINADKFNFGRGRKFDGNSLHNAELAIGSSELKPVLNLQFGQGDSARVEKIKLANLIPEQRHQLLEAIEIYAPQAKLASGIKTKLSADKLKATPANFKGTATLSYNSRPVVSKIAGMISTYERYFWYSWKGTTLATGVMMIILTSLFYGFNRGAIRGGWISPAVAHLMQEFMKSLSAAVTSTFYVASVGASAEAGIGASLVLVFTGVLAAVYLRRPNTLSITSSGLQLNMESLGLKHCITNINWHEIEAVNMSQQAGAGSAAEGNLEFVERSGKKHIVNLKALDDSSQRWILAQAIEKYLPHVQIDARAMTTLKPPVESSFTEVWLAGLNSAPHSQSLVPLKAGDTVGSDSGRRYEIGAVHTIGGQSTVYTSNGIAGTRDLIIKETIIPIFSENVKTHEHVHKFKSEGEFLQSLEHDGLVKVIETFVDGSRGFIVMNRVNGETLQSIVSRSGALSSEKVLDFGRQMSEILKYLHSRQPAIIHRDFTPDNLMLDENGKLVLIDFGVAQNQSDHRTATVVGKHAYMPPEQFRGQASVRSDLYALGATLYYLLTGIEPTPLTKLKVDTTADIAFATADEISIREKLADLIASLTDFDESNRPANADAVLTFLDSLQDGGYTIKLNTTVKETIE